MCDEHDIHPIDKTMAIVCLLLNTLICPGLGTIVHACMGPHPAKGIIYGILQFAFTWVFLIGWVWGIIYGVNIVKKSSSHHHGDHYSKHDDHHHYHHDHHTHH